MQVYLPPLSNVTILFVLARLCSELTNNFLIFLYLRIKVSKIQEFLWQEIGIGSKSQQKSLKQYRKSTCGQIIHDQILKNN